MQNKKVLAALLLILLSNVCPASQVKIDSLHQLLSKQPHDSDLMVISYYMGLHYTRIKPDSSLVLFDQSIKLAQQLGRTDYVHLNEVKLAETYSIVGAFDTSITLIHNALKYYKAQQNQRYVAKCLQSLGMCYGMMGNVGQAIEHTKSAYYLYDELGYNHYLLPCIQNLCLAYGYIGNVDSSRAYFDKAIEVLPVSIGYNLKFLCYAGMGDVYQTNKMLDSANHFFKQALVFNQDTTNSYDIGEYYLLIGKNYVQRGHLDSGLIYLEKSLEIHNEINSNIGLLGVYLEKSALLERQKDYSGALDCYKQYTVVKDSIYKEKKIKALEELEVQYETNKRLQENKLLAAKTELQSLQLSKRNSYIVILILILVIAVIATLGIIKLIRDWGKRKEIDLERKALRSQMNPHFVFNALSSIQHLVYNNDKLFAVKNIAIFAKLMRTVLDQSTQESVTVEEEIQTLKLYLQLESLRFEGRFDYNIIVEDGLPVNQIRIPPVILQPFVENAIKHGLLNKKPSGGQLSVRFFTNGRKLICSIKDDGVGRAKALEIKSSYKTTHQSYSGESIQRRIDLKNKQKGEKITLEIIDLMEGNKATGTEVLLSFPKS